MEENEITGAIVSAAIKVHTALGPGLLESVYKACLHHELVKRGLHVVREHPVPVHYDGVLFELGFRMDLLVEDRVVVEVKAAKANPIHEAQLLSHALDQDACRATAELSCSEHEGWHKADDQLRQTKVTSLFTSVR